MRGDSPPPQPLMAHQGPRRPQTPGAPLVAAGSPRAAREPLAGGLCDDLGRRAARDAAPGRLRRRAAATPPRARPAAGAAARVEERPAEVRESKTRGGARGNLEATLKTSSAARRTSLSTRNVPLSYCPAATTRSTGGSDLLRCALLVLLGFVRREEARLGEVRGEGDEQRHDQDHLAEEARTHQVERDGLVGLAASLI